MRKLLTSRRVLSEWLEQTTWSGTDANRQLLVWALKASCRFDFTVPEPCPFASNQAMPLLWYAMREWPDLIERIRPHLATHGLPQPSDTQIDDWIMAQAARQGPDALGALIAQRHDRYPHSFSHSHFELSEVMRVATLAVPPTDVPAVWDAVFAQTDPFWHPALLGAGHAALGESMPSWTLTRTEALGMKAQWQALFERLPHLDDEALLAVFTQHMPRRRADADVSDDPDRLPARLAMAALVDTELERLRPSPAWTRQNRHQIDDPFMDFLLNDEAVTSSVAQDLQAHPLWRDGLHFGALEAAARAMDLTEALPDLPVASVRRPRL